MYAPRSGSANAGIISLMRGREAGRMSFPAIQRHLSLSPQRTRKVKEQLRNGNSNITLALREIGVSYHVTGVGPGSKSYLVKA